MSAGRDYDVAVIGGGLVGAAIGWGLARAGQRVAVLDEGDVAYRASRGNFALVWVQSKGLGMPEYATWTRRSSDGWSGFALTLKEETGLDVAFQRPGGFTLCLSDAELAARANTMQRLHNQPRMMQYPYEILERGAVEKMLPQIGPEVVGASFCPEDGHVNALRLLYALHLGFQRLGGTYRSNHSVTRIEPGADEFRLHTAAGEITAAHVVLAAGLGNARLAPMLGLHAPVRPQRGQIMIGSRSTSVRIISKDRLPEPITTDARNSTTGTLVDLRTAPTSWRLRRCGESFSSLCPSPPR